MRRAMLDRTGEGARPHMVHPTRYVVAVVDLKFSIPLGAVFCHN